MSYVTWDHGLYGIALRVERTVEPPDELSGKENWYDEANEREANERRQVSYR